MSAWTLRTATPADYPQLVAVLNQVALSPSTVEDFVGLDKQNAAYGPSLRLLLADEAGQVAAMGGLATEPWRAAGTFIVHVVVAPAFFGQGLGRRMYDALTQQARELGGRRLIGNVRDDRPEWRAWAERRGYEVTNHYFKSELHLATFDPAPFRPVVDRAEALGYRFLTLADLPDLAAGQRRLYEVDMDAAIDEPGIEKSTWPPINYEAYATQMFQPPKFDPAAIHIAERDGEWAGFTGLHLRPQRNSAWVAFTGIRRPHRGQGLAQALKLLSAEFAMARGLSKIGTSNNALNPAMLAVNRKLGFQPLPGSYVLERNL